MTHSMTNALSEYLDPHPAECQLSVVIPAYNEQAHLTRNLPIILDYLEGRFRQFEVLVVDDGSTDGTVRSVAPFSARGARALSLGRNRGKGAAVRHGVLASRGRAVLMTDADLSTPMEELGRLSPSMADVPLVVASRALPASKLERPQPPLRRVLGAVFRQIAGWAGVTSIRDTQCGFKLMHGEIARSLFRDMITDGFAFDVELLWLAQRRGHGIREVGIRWLDDPDSRVRPVVDAAAMLFELLRFRIHHASLGRHGKRPQGRGAEFIPQVQRAFLNRQQKPIQRVDPS